MIVLRLLSARAKAEGAQEAEQSRGVIRVRDYDQAPEPTYLIAYCTRGNWGVNLKKV